MKDIESIFVKHGGDFLEPPLLIQEKLQNIKAYIFDWDGVFNEGRKGGNSTSDFTEGDAMGTNMLRFSHYLKQGSAPKMFIATGAFNTTAIEFAEREHFDAVFFRALNKVEILPELKNTFNLDPEQCAFVFDDILDLSLAAKTGLRFFVKKNSNPLLNRYVLHHKLSEYMSGHAGSYNAVREISELIISLNENYDQAIGERIKFSEVYTKFYTKRNELKTRFLKKEGDIFAEFEP